jgi:uncharacterized protein
VRRFGQTLFAAAREKAMQHPLVGGQLLSDDAKTMLLLVTFDDFYLFTDEAATTELKETAERISQQVSRGVDCGFV